MEIIQLIAAFNFLMATGFIWYNRRKLDPAIYVFSFFLLGKGITSLSNGMIAGEVFSDSIFIYGLGILCKKRSKITIENGYFWTIKKAFQTTP